MTAAPVGTRRADGLDATLALVLDAPRLGEALGRPAVVTRLRHKPGVDTLAALADPSGRAAGWVRISHDPARAARDVRRVGAGVGRRALPGGLHLTTGDVPHDPGLAARLRELPVDPFDEGVSRRRDDGDDGSEAGGGGDRSRDVLLGSTVLRHNPARRLVLRRGGQVLRVTAAAQPARAEVCRRAAQAGVVVGGPGVALTPHASRWRWLPGDELGPHADEDVLRETGRLVGRWHGVDVDGLDLPVHDPGAELDRLRRSAADLAAVRPTLGARAADLVARLEPVGGAPALVHGDLSADQVVVGDGGPALLDLDRVRVGDVTLDLGSVVAVEALRSGAVDGGRVAALVLDGWAQERGAAPDRHRLHQATATALLARAGEPLRRADPDWVAGIGRTLDLAEAVLS